MSIVNCDTCGRHIDSDEHPDAYWPEEDAWYCPSCQPEMSKGPDVVSRYIFGDRKK